MGYADILKFLLLLNYLCNRKKKKKWFHHVILFAPISNNFQDLNLNNFYLKNHLQNKLKICNYCYVL